MDSRAPISEGLGRVLRQAACRSGDSRQFAKRYVAELLSMIRVSHDEGEDYIARCVREVAIQLRYSIW